jgi:hypothetical protein
MPGIEDGWLLGSGKGDDAERRDETGKKGFHAAISSS